MQHFYSSGNVSSLLKGKDQGWLINICVCVLHKRKLKFPSMTLVCQSIGISASTSVLPMNTQD